MLGVSVDIAIVESGVGDEQIYSCCNFHPPFQSVLVAETLSTPFFSNMPPKGDSPGVIFKRGIAPDRPVLPDSQPAMGAPQDRPPPAPRVGV